jgi:hypothetical protein
MMRAVSLLFTVFMTVVVGCQRPVATSASASSSTGRANSNAPATVPDEMAARVERVRAILMSIEAGRGTPEMLSSDFKAGIAPPLTDADRKTGFDPRKFDDYLLTLKGKTLGIDEATLMNYSKLGRRSWLTTASDAKGSLSILLEIEGDGAGTVIAWLQALPKSGTLPASLDANAYRAVAFLDSLINQQVDLTIAHLSSTARASLAPVFSKADEARGFNPGTLLQKLTAFRGDAASFEITGVNQNIVKGQFTSPNTVKQPFTIIMSDAETGRGRRIESFSRD